MSLSTDIQAAVKAKPGITSREIAQAVGRDDRKGIARVAALLTQAWRRGKLERETIDGGLRYSPNAHTGSDYRVTARTPTGQSTRPPSHARVQPKSAPARKATPPAPPKPSAEQVAQLSSMFVKPSPRAKQVGGNETVDDFIARGGVIQRLAPGECSRPLASYAAGEDAFPL